MRSATLIPTTKAKQCIFLSLACISSSSLLGWKLPIQFRTWVFEEVLPSIRNKGVYDLEAVKAELALKDKEHQEELNKAMEALSFCISHPKLSRTLNYIYILYGPHHTPKLHQSQHQSSCLHHAQFYVALRQL